MNEEKIKEYIFQAHQAGKSETSGLVQDLKKQINELQGNYSKRELDHYFDEMHEQIKEFRNENKTDNTMLAGKLDYTNGKVRKIIIAIVALGCFVLGLAGKEVALPLLLKMI